MKKFICVLLALTFLLVFAACGEESGSDLIIALTEPTITEAEIETTTVPETEKETTELQTTTTTVRQTTTTQTTVAITTTTTKVYTTAATTSGSSAGGHAGGGGVTVPEAETGPSLVWVPVNGGTKYHSYAGCSGMIDPIQVTVETAIANGYTACKRCW